MKSFWELGYNDLVQPAIKKLQGTVTQTFAKIQVAENNLQAGVNKTSHELHEQTGILGSLREAAVEFFAVEKFMEFGQEIFHASTQMELMRNEFQTLTGDIESGNAAFEQLTDLYKKFPLLGKESIMGAGKTLLEVGVPVDQLKTRLYQMGAVAGGSGEKMNELAEGYARATAFGSVQSRQLMHQPILLQEIGRMYHMNSKALQKFISEGNITLPQLQKAFQNLTGEGGKFYGMLERENDTVLGKWESLKSKLMEDGEKLFTVLEPYLKILLNLAEVYLPKLESAFKNVWRTVKFLFNEMEEHMGLVETLAGLITGLATAYLLYNTILSVYKGLKVGISVVESAYLVYLEMQTGATLQAALAQLGLNAAFLLCPLTWIIAGIGALVGAVIYAWTHFEGFRKVVLGLWYAFKQVFSNIAGFFKETFEPIFKAIQAFKEGRWGDAAKFSAQAIFNLSPVGMAVNATKYATEGGFSKGVAEAYAKGTVAGARSWEESQKKKSTNPADLNSMMKNSLAGKSPSGTLPTAAASGGAQGKNIIIHRIEIGKEIHIHAATVGDGIKDMATSVRKALIAVLNDAETAL